LTIRSGVLRSRSPRRQSCHRGCARGLSLCDSRRSRARPRWTRYSTYERDVPSELLKVAEFSSEAADALARCGDAAVVLDFVRLEPEGLEEVGRTAHQRAAVAAVVERYAQRARYLEGELAELSRHPERFDQREAQYRAQALDSASAFERWRVRRRVLPPFWLVRAQTRGRLRRWRRGVLREADAARRFDPAGLSGKRIEVGEFFGPGLADGGPVSAVDWSRPYSADTLDFTYALCNPPYGLRIGDAELDTLFATVVRQVLNKPDESTEIWSWETEWSPYFDDGRDWWGTGLWTLDVGDAIVAVLAFATD
jgi:hypothetical protein